VSSAEPVPPSGNVPNARARGFGRVRQVSALPRASWKAISSSGAVSRAWYESGCGRLLHSVRTQPNLGSAYFEDLVDKLVKLDARDVVPVILAHLDRPGLAGYERESISAPALASTGGARSSALEAR